MDDTMFGGKRPGKRGWGASEKNIVFGIYQRNRKVLTFPIRGNHVVVLKEKDLPKGRNHINGI